MRLRSSLFLLAGAAACGSVAQQAAAPAVESWPSVAVDVRVQDRSDAPIAGLRPEQLSIHDNGREVAGATLTPSGDEPQSVCLLVDSSGSTYADRDAILEEATTLLRDIPAADETCLIDFSALAYVDAPLTMDRQVVVKGLQYFKSSGGSALRDALFAAAKYMEHNGKFRSRAIVLISDAGENASNASEAQLARVFAERGAPTLYAMLTNGTGTPSGHEDVRRTLKLIDDTGGMTFKPKYAAERRAYVESLIQVMSSRYRLVYAAPDPASDGREHKVDVQLSKDLAKQKMSLSAPRRYYAPGQ